MKELDKLNQLVLRQVMFWSMAVAGALSLTNIFSGRARWLALAAFVLIGLTLALGGHKVPVNDFAGNTPCIGRDWFILDLLGSTLIFICIEKMFALRKAPPGPRPEWQTDFHHWHHSQAEEAVDKNHAAHFAYLNHLFGTAVQSDRAWSEHHGVVGDSVPNGFFKQLALPFRWKG